MKCDMSVFSSPLSGPPVLQALSMCYRLMMTVYIPIFVLFKSFQGLSRICWISSAVQPLHFNSDSPIYLKKMNVSGGNRCT